MSPIEIRDKRIHFFGKLSGATQRCAAQLVREHGGMVVKSFSDELDIIVVGEEELLTQDFIDWTKQLNENLQKSYENGEIEIVSESAFWKTVSKNTVSDENHKTFFTISMVAELVELPIATVRLWFRRGLIVPVTTIRNLAYFDFQEVLTAKALRELLRSGLSPAVLKNRLTSIRRVFSDVQRPLAQLSAFVDGKDILLRKDKKLIDQKGQRRFDFDPPNHVTDTVRKKSTEEFHDTIVDEEPKFESLNDILQCLDPMLRPNGPSAAELCDAALVLEGEGDITGALNAFRTALLAGGPNVETCFQLAELLYRHGDLPAARERFYMVLELDENYVEARANLGCVLQELGEWELAIHAFEGALASHPDYADAHYHLANLFWLRGRKEEARPHFQSFLALYPESPWTDRVREHLTDCER